MIDSLKRSARAALPRAIIDRLQSVKYFFLSRSARQTFKQAVASGEPLDSNKFTELLERYPVKPKSYKYDQNSRDERATQRATDLLSLASFDRFLELGCGDAMVSCMLARAGKNTFAIDYNADKDFNEKSAEGVDKRARAAGVECRTMDAANLDYPEGFFDFVFSYCSASDGNGKTATVL